jgi:hypothetical protein
MATGPEAPRRVTRCSARTEITASQFAALNALPDPIMPVSRRLCCELADGHQDAHLAFALSSHGGVQWWWLRWGRRRHEVVAIDLCEGTEPDGPDPELCLFPDGHPGPHSFDLQPGPARDPAEPDAAPAGRQVRIVDGGDTPPAARDPITLADPITADAVTAGGALAGLIDACQSYIACQLTLLAALRNGADAQAVHPAAQAQLDQLITAVDHAHAQRPRQHRRWDPGE